MKINYKKLAFFILIPLILATIVGLLTTPSSSVQSILPKWVFPVVWTILYVLMGISSYLVYEKTGQIPKIYVIQLILNLLWSFVFFSLKLYLLSYLWIIFLIVLVVLMIKEFLSSSKLAGYLQIPYLIWLIIASFLNLTFLV